NWLWSGIMVFNWKTYKLNLDVNGVIAITGIAYGAMSMILRTLCVWIIMWCLSQQLGGEGITINELTLTTDLFGVQMGDSYEIEYNITNFDGINLGGLFKEAHCEANYAECLTDMAA
ncbi:21527_t:CDS:2, partial [Dentiscutata erythropus]